MKNLILSIALTFAAFIFAGNAHAQITKVNGPAHVQLSMGLGGGSWGSSGKGTPYIRGTFQKRMFDNVGPGHVSVGGSVNYRSGKFSSVGVDWGVTYVSLSARGNWHPDFIKIPKMDTYAGLSFGVEMARTKAKSDDIDVSDLSASATSMTGSLYVGGRYQVTDHLSTFVELGLGRGMINVGTSYNF